MQRLYYTSIIVENTVPEWPSVARRLPEPPILDGELPSRSITDTERQVLLEWIQLSFDTFGKDRSLFFVQSLACIARSQQLLGNQPLVIKTPEFIKVALCSLYDVCILAASFACVREQDKVESIARDTFTPKAQLELLTWFALHASAEELLRAQVERPNELAQSIFDVDAVNQNEVFTAILRQMQKHALLFSTMGGFAVGDWRPSFLSDWIRCALLVRAWVMRNTLVILEKRKTVMSIIARAERSRIAYLNIFPHVVATRPDASITGELVSELVNHANKSSPEACGNFWLLYVGLSDEKRELVKLRPNQVMELTDLSDVEFESLSLSKEFSSNLALFVAATFLSCEFTDCTFTSCDFSQSIFSGCRFSDVVFKYCDGSVTFGGCQFVRCTFEDVKTQTSPAWSFNGCQFDASSQIKQTQPANPTTYMPIAEFENCLIQGSIRTLFEGEWVGFEPSRVRGLQEIQRMPRRDPAEECLIRLLRPFFPPQAGVPGHHQARGYTRTSAIGRGVFPEDAPNAAALITVLEAEGFTSGGRTGHLYAPWSPIVGGSATAFTVRNEMLAFLRNGEQGPSIRRLLERIRRAGSW